MAVAQGVMVAIMQAMAMLKLLFMVPTPDRSLPWELARLIYILFQRFQSHHKHVVGAHFV